MLLKILSENQPAGIRRTIVQGLGELASGKLIPAADQNAVRATLLKLYAEDSDPGVHSAAGWSLTQLAADETIAVARRRFGTGKPPGQRWWYETKVAGIGMAIVAARSDGKKDKQTSAGDPNDDRKQSGRLAVSMCEITEQQYLLSLDESVADTWLFRTESTQPAIVTWHVRPGGTAESQAGDCSVLHSCCSCCSGATPSGNLKLNGC